MNTLRKCRHWLVFGLCLTLLSCSTSMRALDFTPLPDMGHVRAKVDVSGIKYNLRFDDHYPIGGFQDLLVQRLRDHLQAQGLTVVPAAEADYTISGEIAVTEHQKLNGWLAAELGGIAAGSILSLAMPYGLALMVGFPLVPMAGATVFLVGMAGPPLVAASLVAPERTFAKTFQATIVLKDTTGKVLLSKTFDRYRSDCASVYQRGSSGCKKINRTMAQAIDEIFALIANELAFQIPPS